MTPNPTDGLSEACHNQTVYKTGLLQQKLSHSPFKRLRNPRLSQPGFCVCCELYLPHLWFLDFWILTVLRPWGKFKATLFPFALLGPLKVQDCDLSIVTACDCLQPHSWAGGLFLGSGEGPESPSPPTPDSRSHRSAVMLLASGQWGLLKHKLEICMRWFYHICRKESAQDQNCEVGSKSYCKPLENTRSRKAINKPARRSITGKQIMFHKNWCFWTEQMAIFITRSEDTIAVIIELIASIRTHIYQEH